MGHWGGAMKQQAGVIKENFSEFLKFFHREVDCFKELHKTTESQINIFKKSEQKLIFKKERFFNGKELKNWELETECLKIFTHDQLLNNKTIAFSKMLPKVIQNSIYLNLDRKHMI